MISLLKASDAVPFPERLRVVFTEEMKLGRDFLYLFLVTLQISAGSGCFEVIGRLVMSH